MTQFVRFNASRPSANSKLRLGRETVVAYARPSFKFARPGNTLLEMVAAMAGTTVLMAGLSAAVVVSSKAFRPESTAMYAKTNSALAQGDLLADLRLATGFTERTATSVAFTVPDRDGDGLQEMLRYAWSGTVGDPLTLSYNASEPFVVAQDVRHFNLDYATSSLAAISLPAEQTGSQIALLVNDSTSPSVAELQRKSLLESWDFQVNLLGINDGDQAIIAAATAAKALYFSGTVKADVSKLGSALAALKVGVVNEHPDLVSAFGFAASTNDSFGSSISVTDNSHYITSELATGLVKISTLAVPLVLLDSQSPAEFNTLAKAGFSTAPALVTLDSDASLYDGRKAAGRRVHIPWGSDQTNPSQLNNDALLVTRKAVEWATGLGGESLVVKNFGYETVFGSKSGAAGLQYSTKAALSDKARLRSISAYVGGAKAGMRYAIYSDVNGQPGQLLAQSDSGSTSKSMAWVTLDLPPIELEPGNYWLAFSFENSKQRYHHIDSYKGAGERNTPHQAVSQGFLPSWGSSKNSYSGARSIYATYEVIK